MDAHEDGTDEVGEDAHEYQRKDVGEQILLVILSVLEYQVTDEHS